MKYQLSSFDPSQDSVSTVPSDFHGLTANYLNVKTADTLFTLSEGQQAPETERDEASILYLVF